MLGYLKPDVVFGMLKEAQISFTELMYRRGELTNLRDFLVEKRFSIELLEQMSQFGVDLNDALIKGRTPAYILADRNSMDRYETEPDKDEEALARAVEE